MPYYLTDLWKEDFHEMNNEQLWKHYEDCLKAHDWTYSYSDDHGVWQAGEDQYDHLKHVKLIAEELDREKAQKLYWKHSFWFNEDGTPKQ